MANLKDLIVNGSARVLGTLFAEDIRNSSRLTEFIVGTQGSSTGSFTGVTKDSALYDGKNINYFLPYAGSGNATLNLTLSNGTTTGAKPVYLSGTSYVTTQYIANSCINMTYNATKGAWFVNADRDNDTFNRLKNSNNIKAVAACTAGKLICGSASGYKDVAGGVTFNIAYPVLRCGTSIDSGATGTDNYYAYMGVNLQTTKANWTGAQWATVYLVGTLDGNTFTIDSSVFTTTAPTSADGKVYMPIGVLYSTYQCYFYSSQDLYAYNNGKFQPIGDIFIAEYDLTSFAAIKAAVQTGKAVFCRCIGNSFLPLTYFNDSSYTAIFGGIAPINTLISVSNVSDVWGIDTTEYVNKAGDTMTGALIVQGTGEPYMAVKNTEETAGTTPSDMQVAGALRFLDSNDVIVGYIQNEYNTDGSRLTRINSRNANATDYTSITVGFDSSGNEYCNFPNTKRVDGQFVPLNQTLLTDQNLNGSTDLTNRTIKDGNGNQLLPDDGLYLVLFACELKTGTTSGDICAAQLYSDVISNPIEVCRAVTRTSNTSIAAGNIWLPIQNRRYHIYRSSSYTGTVSIMVRGYRRIGSNA